MSQEIISNYTQLFLCVFSHSILTTDELSGGHYDTTAVGFACPTRISPFCSSTIFPWALGGADLTLHCREQPVCWGWLARGNGMAQVRPRQDCWERSPLSPAEFQLVGDKPRAVHGHFATTLGSPCENEARIWRAELTEEERCLMTLFHHLSLAVLEAH